MVVFNGSMINIFKRKTILTVAGSSLDVMNTTPPQRVSRLERPIASDTTSLIIFFIF